MEKHEIQHIVEPDGTIKGEVFLEIIQSAWKRWHLMSYTDLLQLLDELNNRRQHKYQPTSVITVTEQEGSIESRTARKDLNPAEWRHLEGKLSIEIHVLRAMIDMVYTEGWPLPSWEKLSKEKKRRIGKGLYGIYAHDHLIRANKIIQDNPGIEKIEQFKAIVEEDKEYVTSGENVVKGVNRYYKAVFGEKRKEGWTGFRDAVERLILRTESDRLTSVR